MHLAPTRHVSHDSLLLLAPAKARIPAALAGARVDLPRHRQLLRELQKFRGQLYLQDEAILPADLLPDGRHELPIDHRAWHLLALNPKGDICGCVRYVHHANTVAFSQLGTRNAALARDPEWAMRLKAAVDSEVGLARDRGVAFVEVGGWALAPQFRHTVEALRLALATYSLARALGGCIGITTATERHGSADILGRIGGVPLALEDVELPPYYDPQYRCHMRILRFDSGRLNPRFERWVKELSRYLEKAPVIRAASQAKWAAMAAHVEAGDDAPRVEPDLVAAV